MVQSLPTKANFCPTSVPSGRDAILLGDHMWTIRTPLFQFSRRCSAQRVQPHRQQGSI